MFDLGTSFTKLIVMFEFPIHVVDFEGSRQSGVVEYGCVTLEQGELGKSYTRICAPVGKISKLDRVQHGITESDAEQEAPFTAEWSLFAGLRETGLFCAHNSTVEEGFLRAVWPFPRNSPHFLESGLQTATWGPWLDTLHLYRRIYPHLGSYKLEDLVQLFDLQSLLNKHAASLCSMDRSNYHCALYDALGSALLLQRLGEEPSLQSASQHWFFMQSAASDNIYKARGQQELL